MFLNFVNSECVGTSVLLATNSTDGIAHIGGYVVDHFSQLVTRFSTQDGGAVLQQFFHIGRLLFISLLAHINLV